MAIIYWWNQVLSLSQYSYLNDFCLKQWLCPDRHMVNTSRSIMCYSDQESRSGRGELVLEVIWCYVHSSNPFMGEKKPTKFVKREQKSSKAEQNPLLLCRESEKRSLLPGRLMNNPQISSWALGSERLVSHPNTNQPVWNIHFKRKWGGPFKESRRGEGGGVQSSKRFFLSFSLSFFFLKKTEIWLVII